MSVRITSKREGFRRCGIDHSSTPVIWPDDRFTPAQLKQLQDEPMLIVDIVSGADVQSGFVKPTVTLAELIARADMETLRNASVVIHARFVAEAAVPELLALRDDISLSLLQSGYIDPAPSPTPDLVADVALVSQETAMTGDGQPPAEAESVTAIPPVKADLNAVKSAEKKTGK